MGMKQVSERATPESKHKMEYAMAVGEQRIVSADDAAHSDPDNDTDSPPESPSDNEPRDTRDQSRRELSSNEMQTRPRKRRTSDASIDSIPNPLREHPVEAPDGSPPRSSLLKRRRIEDYQGEVMVYRRANGEVVMRRIGRFAL